MAYNLSSCDRAVSPGIMAKRNTDTEGILRSDDTVLRLFLGGKGRPEVPEPAHVADSEAMLSHPSFGNLALLPSILPLHPASAHEVLFIGCAVIHVHFLCVALVARHITRAGVMYLRLNKLAVIAGALTGTEGGSICGGEYTCPSKQ